MRLGTLTAELDRLAQEFEERDLPLILAGGMGLYIRDLWLDPAGRSANYPRRPQSRTTEDLDLFLNPRLLSDPTATETIREILDDFGYNAREEHFIFERAVTDGPGETVEIDLLGAPPSREDRGELKVGDRRVRPYGFKRLHGRLTEEAEHIDFGKIEIELNDIGSDFQGSVYIPSSLNYCILKLHAFRERLDRNEEFSARRHAFDVFRIVTDMRESDWQQAGNHWRRHAGARFLQRTGEIRKRYFSERPDDGMVRIREHSNFDRETFDPYLPQFLQDLEDLTTPFD